VNPQLEEQVPPHQSWIPYEVCLLVINCLIATGSALLVARLRLKSQTKGAALYAVLYLILVLRYVFLHQSQGAWNLFPGLTLNRFLIDADGYLRPLALSFGVMLFLVLQFSYYLLIVLFVLRPRKKSVSGLKGHLA
jgi:hypothetical protein